MNRQQYYRKQDYIYTSIVLCNHALKEGRKPLHTIGLLHVLSAVTGASAKYREKEQAGRFVLGFKLLPNDLQK